MKVTFVTSGIGISGGVKNIFEFANHLSKRGHEVTVIYPLIPPGGWSHWRHPRSFVTRVLGSYIPFVRGARVDWFGLKTNLVIVPTLAKRFIPDADIIMATSWKTGHYVSECGRSKGEKFYLVQHYEVWDGPREEVDRTYKLGLRNIVHSTWLKNILEDRLGTCVEDLIVHAPDREQFFPEMRERDTNTIRVLLPYRNVKWKGMEDGIRAFEIARKKHPNIQLVTFGDTPSREEAKYAEVHGWTCGDKLRKIYNSCDILLFPSHHEGFGMPPMEAMACNLAVVSTNVGGIPASAMKRILNGTARRGEENPNPSRSLISSEPVLSDINITT